MISAFRTWANRSQWHMAAAGALTLVLGVAFSPLWAPIVLCWAVGGLLWEER